MLEVIKTCFDIRAVSLANYLEASLGTVNSIASGRRLPNLPQLQRIVKLQKALALETKTEALPNAGRFINTETEALNPLLLRERKRLSRELSYKKGRLKALHNTHEAWLRGLHACTSLLDSGAELETGEYNWVALRKRHLQHKLKEQSLYKKKTLKAEIAGIVTQITALGFFDHN